MDRIREGVKKSTFQGPCPLSEGGGGGPPPSAEIVLKTKCKNTQHPLNFIKTVFLYCRPCLTTGSDEMFMKKGELLSRKVLRGEGGVRA